MQKILTASFLLLVLFFSGVGIASAATKPQLQFQPIVSVPLPTGGALETNTSLTDYLNGVFTLTIAFAAILGVVMMTFDGFQYMTSDVIGNKKKAIEGLQGAAFGLILLLLAYVILNVINPNILKIENLTKDLNPVLSGTDSKTVIPATSAADCKSKGGDATGDGKTTVCVVATNSDAAAAANACSNFKSPEAAPVGASCAILVSDNYVRIDNQCCDNLATGHQCCALPK